MRSSFSSASCNVNCAFANSPRFALRSSIPFVPLNRLFTAVGPKVLEGRLPILRAGNHAGAVATGYDRSASASILFRSEIADGVMKILASGRDRRNTDAVLKRLDHATLHLIEFTIDPATGGVPMATSSKYFGDLRNIILALRTKTYSVRSGSQFLEECYGLNVADRKRMIYDSIRIFFAGLGFIHSRTVHGNPCNSSRLVVLDVGQHKS